MLKYLPYAIQGIAALGGVALGLWLKSSAAPATREPVAAHEQAASHDAESTPAPKKPAKEAAAHKPKGKKAGHGGHGESKGDEQSGFMKFSRQFVIPVLDKSGVKSLVVMDINIEVPPDEAESVYQREPKLRDALLSALLKLSNSGAFSAKLLDQSNLDGVRAELLKAARSIIGEDAQNVLILNITRQDV